MVIRFFCWGLAAFLCLTSFSSALANTDISSSINKALRNNPRLKVLQNNRDALVHELRQAKGGYLPKLDLAVGYGIEQHSDRVTRVGTDPGDEDWESRGEASLVLDQLLYDGGVVSGRIALQRAKLESASRRVFDNAEAIALDAVIAHLAVYRQRKLVALAEDNIAVHQEILRSLEERQRAGAGSIADVTQTQGRLARARASLASAKAELGEVSANYLRVVGEEPAEVSLAGVPASTPEALEMAVELARQYNPKVDALTADIAEAEARKKQARAADFPKLNLELSSDYEDQLQGDNSWQNTNAGMVRLRWNLYNGGSDAAGKRAARYRVQQAVASRDDQLVDIVEETQATWAQYQAAKERRVAFSEAVDFSKQTLDSYLKQFNVAQRSLLDVLDAENELFQSSGLWVTAQVNETIGAARLLALAGRLQGAKEQFLPVPEPDISIESLELSAQRINLGSAPLPLETPPAQRLSRGEALKPDSDRIMLARPEPILEPAERFLERWAGAWSAQDVETYLASYAEDFVPQGGLDRAAWERQRRLRLQAPGSIQVELSNMKTSKEANGRMIVRADQEYRSDRYADRVRKEFLLKEEGGRWFILEEKELGKLP